MQRGYRTSRVGFFGVFGLSDGEKSGLTSVECGDGKSEAFMHGRPAAEYPIPAPTSSEWTKVAERSWERFKQVLGSLPSGRTEADPAAIADATQALVDLFDQWMRDVGFEWDEPYFVISREYLTALESKLVGDSDLKALS